MENNNSWAIIIGKLSDFELKRGITSFVNPYSMLILKDNEKIAQGVDHWYVDGISLVKLIGWLFNKKISRFSFDDTSVAPLFFTNVAKNKQRLAIVGTKPNIIIKSVRFIEDKYGLKVQYFRDGFMNNDAEKQETIRQIIDQNIEVVVCGMGTPHQEEFLIRLKNSGWDGYGYTCGGYLHQIANSNKDKYYPEIFNKLHIRWIYRILDEPKLISRYLIKYPHFLSQLLIFSLKFKNQ